MLSLHLLEHLNFLVCAVHRLSFYCVLDVQFCIVANHSCDVALIAISHSCVVTALFCRASVVGSIAVGKSIIAAVGGIHSCNFWIVIICWNIVIDNITIFISEYYAFLVFECCS